MAKSKKRGAGARNEEAQLVLGASKNGVQKRVGRPSDWTEAKAAKFIEVLSDSCNVALAARAVNRSVGNVYIQRTKSAAFRAAWDQALAIGYAKLEMMMLERALHGVEKTVTLRNGDSKIMREYNDRVALALLRHHRDSVAAFENAAEDDEYEEACERIIERLQRLRERECGSEEPPLETKTVCDRLPLIALAIRQQRSAGSAAAPARKRSRG